MTNEGCSRMIVRGNWVGTVLRYRCCVQHAKLTWPRHVHSILKASVCRAAIPIGSPWYEFATAGPGILHDDDSPGYVLTHMDDACSFDDIDGANQTIRVLAMEAEDAGAQILLQGYNDSNQWIRTTDGTSFFEGEYVSLTQAGTDSAITWANLTGAIKPVTKGPIWIHQKDITTGALKPLAMYEPDETVPMYRRSRIPNLAEHGICQDDDCCADPTTKVNVMAKMKHVDAVNDDDYVSVPNLAAIKLMVMAIDKEEKNLFAEARQFEALAIRELEHELMSYHGGGAIPQYDVQEPALFGAGAIEGAI
jgi:hypothetical protein